MREALAGLRPATQLQALRATLRLACDAGDRARPALRLQALLHVYAADAQWPDVEPLARYLGAQTSLLASESGGNPFDRRAASPGSPSLRSTKGVIRLPPTLRGADRRTARPGRCRLRAGATRDLDAIIAYLAQQRARRASGAGVARTFLPRRRRWPLSSRSRRVAAASSFSGVMWATTSSPATRSLTSSIRSAAP